MNNTIISEVRKEAEILLKRAKGSHSIDHSERVLKLAQHLAEAEKADREVVTLAALLHDIAKNDEDDSKGVLCHAKHGAEVARKILSKYPLSKEKIDAIIYCISSHRFDSKEKPKTLEAKIIFDADKLDVLGAVGLARNFVFTGEGGLDKKFGGEENMFSNENTTYRYYLSDLSKVKNHLFTLEGKRIAEERTQFMQKFFERMLKEAEGEI